MTHPTTIQPSLFDRTTYNKFLDYHIKFPRVYVLFERFALEALRNGKTKIGSKAIIERIRWENYTGSEKEEWKINNRFTPHYARLFMNLHPEHKDCFETRELKS
jgi:hypothetical protein